MVMTAARPLMVEEGSSSIGKAGTWLSSHRSGLWGHRRLREPTFPMRYATRVSHVWGARRMVCSNDACKAQITSVNA